MESRSPSVIDPPQVQKPWQVIDPNVGFDNSYDLIIKTETRQFQAHQAKVSKNSPPLTAKMEGPWQEAQVGALHAGHFDAGTIERFLDYQYCQDYNATSKSADPIADNECSKGNRVLLVHLRMIAIATHFEVIGLRDMAIASFEKESTSWSLKGFEQVLVSAYSVFPLGHRVLQDMVWSLVDQHWEIVYRTTGFADALNTCGSLAIDIIGAREAHHKKELETANVKLEDREQESKDHHKTKLSADIQAQELEALEQHANRLQTQVQQRDQYIQAKKKKEGDLHNENIRLKSELSKANTTTINWRKEYIVKDVVALNLDHRSKMFEHLLKLCNKHGACCVKSTNNFKARYMEDKWHFRCPKCSKSFRTETTRAGLLVTEAAADP